MRIVLIFLVTLSTIFAAENNPSGGVKDSCSSCIKNPNYVWCSDENLMERCFLENSINAKNCVKLTNPQNEVIVLENKTLSAAGGNIVQIQPQKILLKLKPNKPQKIQVNYMLAKDQPVDLYFLMDISESTRPFKEALGRLGKKLAEEMKNITSDFRLGFGSFLDKTVMPFTSTLPEHLKEPCRGCIPPYSFRNHMPLDSDASRFEKIVADAKVSGNVDGPEGGFDGIMQAMVCQKDIGWRKDARRLLLVFTDSGSHIAGDGKLGGIIDRNDGLCHLDGNGYYTHDKLQDYPSIPQINLIARRESINIIFVITKAHLEVYQEISKRINGSSSAKLNDDSSNILNIIRDQYKKIRSSVELQDDLSIEDSVKISYKSKCTTTGTFISTRKCLNLEVGKQVDFEIELNLKSCTDDRSKFKKSINIMPVGVSEQLTIDLEYLCSCACDNQEEVVLDSPVCRGNGNLRCGICECKENYSGSICNCTNIDSLTDTSKCIDPNNRESGEECNNRGSCVCGECKCESNSRFFGKFCECDNQKCSQYSGLICSGPEQGICGCNGKCECIPPYTGEACECRDSNDTCISPLSPDSICSEHGDCVCSKCNCQITKEGRYFGKHCEHSTFSARCNELKNCVYCTIYDKICSETNFLKVLFEPNKWFLVYHCSFVKEYVQKVFGSSSLKKNACSSNCSVDYQVEFTDRPIDFALNNLEKPCIAYDEENCQFQFMYIEDEVDNRVKNLIAHKALECPNELNMVLTIIGVSVVILLIGILTLIIWRFAVWIHDRKEYSKFQIEIQRMGMRDNPLYDSSSAVPRNNIPMKRIQI